jgi:aspartate oxidase
MWACGRRCTSARAGMGVWRMHYDVAIIGGGIAGLTVALSLPPERTVLLIT